MPQKIDGRRKYLSPYDCRPAKRHNMFGTPEYRTWNHMIQRCNNPKNDAYHYYGGRGIRVCSRWLEFHTFYTDMGKRPKGTSIDRFPDNDGDYEPSNCRWATTTEQRKNQRMSNRNKTGILGVHWLKSRKKYVAQIRINGKPIHLGSFIDMSDAIEARRQGEIKYWEN